MEAIPFNVLIGLLIGLLVLSAFFSSSETGLMALNPYRLRHLAKVRRSAALIHKRLKRPDRILGVILLGNNLVNILAASIATVLAIRLGFDPLLSSLALTAIVLIFAEVSPKTLAVLYPEMIAFPAIYVLEMLLWILYPFVWLINTFSNLLLRVLGVSSIKKSTQHLSTDELRTLIHETAGKVPIAHREMVLSILDLENVSIDEIMVPRVEVIGLDFDNSEKELLTQLASTQHTFLPVYRDDLNQTIGILHTRNALNMIADGTFSKENMKKHLLEPYYVPEATSLTHQMLQFKDRGTRIALVVNEYGDIQGLVTLEDILEEVVGEFTTDMAQTSKDIHPQEDGTFVVDASVTIRELNRAMNWKLPTQGPKTLSGVVIDFLQSIPEAGTCVLIDNIPIEVLQVIENRIKTVRISPPIKRQEKEKE